MGSPSSKLVVLFFLFLAFSSKIAAKSCRCLPSDACWPNQATWQSFNASIDGALIPVKPVCSVCHDPDYDEAACKIVTASFNDPFWRASQPGALQGANLEMEGQNGCSLTGPRTAPCSQGSLPVYAVRVSKAADVQNAVTFAAEHSLRLVIKNTGHDFTGKNTATGSLSIWMHNLKDITFSDSFQVQCPTEQPRWSHWFPWFSSQPTNTSSVKIGAGVQWEELYKAAHDNGRVVVGAQCSSVGASGGFVQGAGHSQLSPTYGLAADNVLQFEVVTADGKLVVANSCQNEDLFWALRGGGGGTFGVVVSTTYATHPPLESLVFASYVVTAATASSLQGLLEHFIGLNPSLSDSGWGGFFMLSANHTLIVQFLLPNKDVPFAKKTFEPLDEYVKNHTKDLTVLDGRMQLFSSYYDWHKAVQCSGNKCGYPSGFELLEASRLVPRKVVEDSASGLAETLVSIQELGYQRVSGYMVAGGKVSSPASNNAVHPAWRRALLHVLFVKPIPTNSTLQGMNSMAEELTVTSKKLRGITKRSGTYLNEADPNEPHWKSSFFGSNYMALKAVKAKVDPDGLFVCKHCVGSDDWTEDLNCRARS